MAALQRVVQQPDQQGFGTLCDRRAAAAAEVGCQVAVGARGERHPAGLPQVRAIPPHLTEPSFPVALQDAERHLRMPEDLDRVPEAEHGRERVRRKVVVIADVGVIVHRYRHPVDPGPPPTGRWADRRGGRAGRGGRRLVHAVRAVGRGAEHGRAGQLGTHGEEQLLLLRRGVVRRDGRPGRPHGGEQVRRHPGVRPCLDDAANAQGVDRRPDLAVRRPRRRALGEDDHGQEGRPRECSTRVEDPSRPLSGVVPLEHLQVLVRGGIVRGEHHVPRAAGVDAQATAHELRGQVEVREAGLFDASLEPGDVPLVLREVVEVDGPELPDGAVGCRGAEVRPQVPNRSPR